ncbi:LacI family transcriptional regulator [Actinotalea sp. M2MS4P-6]|uniref:LacI family DNA-binding transcriptional regulator n=1 Tax=Actinotalea sp. M2MS4P-6 TaxID=2983762 RepID=UPI0021E3955D|nr:LacI family DNA-binding transcriptional regulator [Actinotalea sp. M2MS4P-6]MCV2394942.1 LacI family transcriptional regulator [Actinotalea sp. M2MS4P-6]
MGRVTLQTVADHVGVSRMTVSNAFSRPDQLSSELREKILAAADELGYVGPDPAGRALARGATGAIGVLLTKSVRHAFTDPIAAEFFGAVAESLAPTGMAVALLPSGLSTERIPARDIPIDGALIYACAGDSEALSWLRKRRLPLVYVDQAPEGEASSVLLDDRGGARAAARHLVELGHRKVGLIAIDWYGPHGLIADPTVRGTNYVANERVAGWLEGLGGVEVVAVQAQSNAERDAYEGAQLLLDTEDPPTAVLCFSDLMAWGVVHAAHDLGLRVPEDLSVVGFDDSALARSVRPALTTVHQDLVAKGHLAAQLLVSEIARVRAGEPVEARHELLPLQLVVRRSTGPAPA